MTVTVLTMDLVLYVDDLSHIGDEDQPLDEEGEALDNYLEIEIGIPMEKPKTRRASQIQLSLGLWWNNFMARRREGGPLFLHF